MGDNLKRFLQSQSNMEADRIMEQVNQDPSLDGVHAPEELHDALFAQIEAYEKAKAQSNLSEEDQELIRLGKVYKRKRKSRKNLVAALAVICIVGATGITAMGGPERVLEKVTWMLAGREQTNVDSDSERVEPMSGVDEVEVFEQIKEEFGFEPVRMNYMPDGMKLILSSVGKDVQLIDLIYDDEKSGVITYLAQPNYRIGSAGEDIEDKLEKSEILYVRDVQIAANKYYTEEDDSYSWHVLFEFQDVFYKLKAINIEDEDVYKIIENLYFPTY